MSVLLINLKKPTGGIEPLRINKEKARLTGLVQGMSSLKSENSYLRDKLAKQNRDIGDHKKSILVINKVADKLNPS